METVPAPPFRASLRRLPRTVLRLRCPACGRGALLKSWFTAHERCAACGVVFERQEGAGIGVMVLAYAVAAIAGLVAVGLVVWLYGDVPYLTAIGASVAAVAVVASWPFCKAAWTWLLWATGLVFPDPAKRS